MDLDLGSECGCRCEFGIDNKSHGGKGQVSRWSVKSEKRIETMEISMFKECIKERRPHRRLRYNAQRGPERGRGSRIMQSLLPSRLGHQNNLPTSLPNT